MSSPASPRPSRSRLSNVDALRGFAATAVCLFHFSRDHFLGTGATDSIAQMGYLGVPVFFVISGFVIPLALESAHFALSDTGRFLASRFLRLYPAFVAAVVVTIASWYASSLVPSFRGHSPHFSQFQLLANATLSADAFHQEWVIPVSWTLAIEAQFYATMALTFPFSQSRLPGRAIFVAAWIGVALLPPLKATVLPFGALFALGILGFHEKRRSLPRPMVVALVTAATLVQGLSDRWPSAMAGAATFVAVAFVPDLSFRPLVALGTISYSLYLVHVAIGGKVVNAGERWAKTELAHDLVVVLALGVSGLVAYAFYVVVERPSHLLARRWWPRPTTSTS